MARAMLSAYTDATDSVPGVVRVDGNFTTNGASSPTVFSSGQFSVVRTGAGALRINLKTNLSEILAVQLSIEGATANNDNVITTARSVADTTNNSGNASVTLETQTVAGTAGDLTGIIVHFSIVGRKGANTR